jgi:hypothetical protein
MSDIAKSIPLSTFNSASISGTYQAINANGLPNACFFVRIVNGGTTPITISYDGVNDNEYIRANSDFELPSQTNSQPDGKKALSPVGRVYWVKGTAGTGFIALSGYYV